jgi:hypothetical protein
VVRVGATTSSSRALFAASLLLALALVTSGAADAQWLKYPAAGTPRLPDGTPNLTAAAPRTTDGKPDLSGIWEVVGDLVMPTDGRIRSKYVYNIASDLPAGAPFQPWAKQLHDERTRALGVGAPSESCLPHGIPDAMLTRQLPFKIIQNPGMTIVLFEEFNNWRQIFTDGRPLPQDPDPTFNGYSVGRWDGDTLVVQTNGLREGTWLDRNGSPISDVAKMTERFRRVNYGRLEIDLTIDDAKAYTRPWTVTLAQRIVLDTELMDYHCTDNEKSQPHMVGK